MASGLRENCVKITYFLMHISIYVDIFPYIHMSEDCSLVPTETDCFMCVTSVCPSRW